MISATSPVGRIVNADDIARAVLFCMENTFLTGQTSRVDGGQQPA